MTAHESLEHPWLVSVQSETKDLLPNVRRNFNARKTFKRAVDMVRLSYHLNQKHMSTSSSGSDEHHGVEGVKPVNEGIDHVLHTED